MSRLLARLEDWLCDRLGLCISFDGDLVTPDWHEGDGDPHYRPVRAPIVRGTARRG